jgi:predicted metalloprotease
MADWSKVTSRGNVEDRRSFSPVAVGGMGLGGLLVLMAVNYLLGGNPLDALNQVQGSQVVATQDTNNPEFEGEDTYEVFASTVLGSNNDAWRNIFSQSKINYVEPKLVLFRAAVETSCGTATSEVGPFYCPLDETIYLDETFFDELQNRFGGSSGDVAQAYVISHEVGHHIQNLIGNLENSRSNEDSIKTELQADCYAGIWANSIKDRQILEPNEIKEALDSAAAVGDDRIQQKVSGYVNPETWTHGSSEQRVQWFTTGYDSGNPDACDTFGTL